MHAGELPGYPASAGCIRLPYHFSELIYSVMQNGSTVVITKKGATPSRSSSPASILLSSKARHPSDRSIPAGRVLWEPRRSKEGPISMLLSYADSTVYVWRNGVQIGQSPLRFRADPQVLPEGVFVMLEGQEPSDPRFPGLTMHPWTTLSLSGGEISGNVVQFMRDYIDLPPDFRKAVNQELKPGAILVATKESSTKNTRSQAPMAIGVPSGPPPQQ